MRALLAACLLACAGFVVAQSAPRVMEFEEAEVEINTHLWLPPAAPTWKKVSLPHNWHAEGLASGYGLYRVRIHLDQPPGSPWAVAFPRRASHSIAIHANGQVVARVGSPNASAYGEPPLIVAIPPGMLKQGENVITVHIRALPEWFHGMTRITVGEIGPVARIHDNRLFARSYPLLMFIFGFALVSLLALAIWWRVRRDDPTILWFAACGLTWSGIMALLFATRHLDLGTYRTGLFFLTRFAISVPIAVLCLRALGRKHPWLEGAMWMAMAGSAVAVAPSTSYQGNFYSGLGMAWSALVAFFVGLLFYGLWRRRLAAVWPLGAALVAIVLADLHDIGRNFGWVDFDNMQLKIWGVATLLLALGFHLVDQHLAAVREVQGLNLELEGRVAEKTREIERQHARLVEVERERALRDERRRIMADMHDGLGSRLVALLSLLRQPRTEIRLLEEEAHGALDELRIAVDSLAPVEGDIGVVLGNVRHRMRTVFDRAGVSLSWQVAQALPQIEGLTPARVLAIQRFLLEVFTNILKHSGARTVGVAALQTDGAVSIVIDDSGRGFDPAAAQGGQGLGNLRRRATEAGGAVDVASAPGQGTRVTLTLPIARGADAREHPAPDLAYPISGISAKRDAA